MFDRHSRLQYQCSVVANPEMTLSELKTLVLRLNGAQKHKELALLQNAGPLLTIMDQYSPTNQNYNHNNQTEESEATRRAHVKHYGRASQNQVPNSRYNGMNRFPVNSQGTDSTRVEGNENGCRFAGRSTSH